jgi:hypothetical protein
MTDWFEAGIALLAYQSSGTPRALTYNNFMRTRSIALVSLLLLTASAHALDLAGRDLFIPVAGRTPGAAGTFWQTDLVITNHSPEYAKLPVHVEFSSDGSRESLDVEVVSGSSVVLEDFVRTRLGREAALGTIRITSDRPDAQLTAHAVVYNTSAAEPLGQTVQGLPVSALRTQSLIGGLLLANGHRSNVGVANPNDEPVTVSLSAPNGGGGRTITVAPRSFVQMDAATAIQFAASDALSILVSASLPVYAYGSVIRNGDGDPQFVPPVETRTSNAFAVAPSCTSPAQLDFQPNPAPGYIVVFDEGLNVEAVTADLAARHHFTPIYVYAAISLGFYAELTPAQLAALRCEPAVQYIEQNAWAFVSGSRTTADSLVK